MKRLLMLSVAALTAATVAVAATASTQTVQITKNGFTPQTATVSAGDTVTWHNADTADHQVVADDGSFASPVLHTDQSYSHTFTGSGTVKYHDSFARTHAGSVVVSAPAGTVSLSASAPTVVYGNGTTLSGSVSNQLASEPVTLTAQAFDKSTQSIDAMQTTANGAFHFAVSPTIRTSYQAHWLAADSRPVTVEVAPRVGFGRSGRIFIAKVTSDLTYAGHFVWVQRHFGFGWKSMKRVFLGANSRAVFGMKTPHGRTMLRLLLPAGQAGAGYVAGLSRTIVVHR